MKILPAKLLIPALLAAALLSSCRSEVGPTPLELAIQDEIKRVNPEVESFRVTHMTLLDTVTLGTELARREKVFTSKYNAEKRLYDKYTEKRMPTNAAKRKKLMGQAQDILADLSEYRTAHARQLDSCIYFVVLFNGDGYTRDGAYIPATQFRISVSTSLQIYNMMPPKDGNIYRGMGICIPGYLDILASHRLADAKSIKETKKDTSAAESDEDGGEEEEENIFASKPTQPTPQYTPQPSKREMKKAEKERRRSETRRKAALADSLKTAARIEQKQKAYDEACRRKAVQDSIETAKRNEKAAQQALERERKNKTEARKLAEKTAQRQKKSDEQKAQQERRDSLERVQAEQRRLKEENERLEKIRQDSIQTVEKRLEEERNIAEQRRLKREKEVQDSIKRVTEYEKMENAEAKKALTAYRDSVIAARKHEADSILAAEKARAKAEEEALRLARKEEARREAELKKEQKRKQKAEKSEPAETVKDGPTPEQLKAARDSAAAQKALAREQARKEREEIAREDREDREREKALKAEKREAQARLKQTGKRLALMEKAKKRKDEKQLAKLRQQEFELKYGLRRPEPVRTFDDDSSFTAIVLCILLVLSGAAVYVFIRKGRKNRIPRISVSGSDCSPINLGLSVMWSNCNIGAASPYEDGAYFSWGETKTKDYFDKNDYISPALADGTATLPTQSDTAHACCGRGWRMPTEKDYLELLENCTVTAVHEDDKHGMLLTSKLNGASIFFPAAGYADKGLADHVFEQGSYWTAEDGKAFTFNASSNASIETRSRHLGLNVRPVKNID